MHSLKVKLPIIKSKNLRIGSIDLAKVEMLPFYIGPKTKSWHGPSSERKTVGGIKGISSHSIFGTRWSFAQTKVEQFKKKENVL